MHHAPLLLEAEDHPFTQECVDYVLNSGHHIHSADFNTPKGLDERHLAVLAYTDAMTKNVKVPDDVFARLKKCFSDREVVEITATVGAYNCVSRFLVALDVGEMNEVDPRSKAVQEPQSAA